MTAEHWGTVRLIVESATKLGNERARKEFLDQRCGSDEELRFEVEQLLGFETRAGNLFSIESWIHTLDDFDQSESTAGLPPGTLIGNYRIKEELGHGGMGVVYLAQRVDGQYQQDVAIKVLRGSIVAPQLRQRFVRERQILAHLSHPGIARLLDGGVTPDARPYFVLEYVRGERIDVFCERNSLTLRARLELFLDVAAAVQSAHQQLILHLDLKPANILVTTEGEPRLLDFGIARILSESDAAAARADATLRLLTPRYASPEQAAGLPVGIASDVFSLGTLLYRLLTGALPYPVEKATPLEAVRLIREVPATPPSDAAPPELRPALRGDLDVILLHALRKEPERRYATVAAFAEDIKRHLAYKPIRAHPDSFRYRSTKFLRRNRFTVISAVAVLLILLASGAAILRSAAVARRERTIAESRLHDVRNLAHSYVFDLDPQLKAIPGTIAVRGFIAKKALAYLEQMSRQTSLDPHLEAELAAGYATVGNMQCDLAFPHLGERAGAIQSLTRAVALQERVVAADPANLAAQADLVVYTMRLGQVFMILGDIGKDDQIQHRAWDLAQPLIAAGPSAPSYFIAGGPAWIIGTFQSGNGDLWNFADPTAGLLWLDRAIGIYARWLATNPGSLKAPRAQTLWTYAVDDRVRALQQLGRVNEARAALDVAIKQQGPRPPSTSNDLRTWINVHETSAEFLRGQHDLAGAAAMADGILSPQTPQSALDNPGQLDFAEALGIVSRIDLESGRVATGLSKMRHSLEILQRLYSSDPENSVYSAQLAHNLLYFADEKRLDAVKRRDLYNRALEVTAAYRTKHPSMLSANILMAKVNLGLAQVVVANNQPVDQRKHAQSAIQNLSVVLAAHPIQPEASELLAQAKDLARR